MSKSNTPATFASLFCLLLAFFPLNPANSQTRGMPIALKSGETVDLQEQYYVIKCRSMLTGPITAEILQGPPEISVNVREARVFPRQQACAQAVKGAIISLTAKDIDDTSNTRLIIRLTMPTKDGERKMSLEYSLSLIP